MPVSTQNIQVAECDAPRCTVRRVAAEVGGIPDGYQITVQVLAENNTMGETIELWVCRQTHAGPAIQDAAHTAGWRDRKDGPTLAAESQREPDGLVGDREGDDREEDEAERDAQQQAEQDADFADDESDGAPTASRG